MQIFRDFESTARAWERALYYFTEGLIQARMRPLAHGVLRAARKAKEDHPARPDAAPVTHPEPPAGPFRQVREGALLVFVPRNLSGRLIDDLSGGFGYSHVAVDAGEVDVPSGLPVMIESYPGLPVRRCFLDIYDGRPFARIPVSRLGVGPKCFLDCVLSKLGERYDYIEALTWGQVDDPARQICSNLVTVCLPEEIQEDIIRQHRKGRLSPAAISLHTHADGSQGLFVSPNGFCQYYGAPQGRSLPEPDVLVSGRSAGRRLANLPDWTLMTLLAAGAALGGIFWLRRGKLHSPRRS